MIRHSLALAKAQEFAQRQAVRATPFQPTLAVDAFKVADQQHTEVASRRQRWTAEARCIVQATLRLHEPIETCRDQNRLQLVVEGRGLESVASQPTTPACPPGVPAAVQEPSATSRPRQTANESNQGRLRQRAVKPQF